MAGAKPTKPSSRKAAGAASRKTALQLHIEGHTFEVIGKRLGISRQRAHKMVQEQLAEAAAERSKLGARALDTDLERVDFVMRSLVPRIEKGDDKAAQAYLRAMERRAKLLGLDAPTRTDSNTTLTGPGGGAVAVDIASTDPTALHARLAAAAARAARGADPGATGDADPARAAGD